MITEAGPLNLRLGSIGVNVKIHPTVLVTICDSFIRRKTGLRRVIGTLLGSGTDDAIIVKDCYAVPHEEDDDQVMLDVAHHKTMLELNQRVHPKQTVVGWFATGLGVSTSDALIHNFYSNGQQSGCGIKAPTHLVVDTSFAGGERVSIKAYVSKKLMLGATELATEFVEVPTQILTNTTESMGLLALRQEKLDALPTDTDSLRTAFLQLQDLVSQAHAYVQDVVEGKRPADVTIGRYLSDVVAAVPCSDKQEFKELYETCTQDILCVMYLSSLIRSHIALAEKLATFALPLA